MLAFSFFFQLPPVLLSPSDVFNQGKHLPHLLWVILGSNGRLHSACFEVWPVGFFLFFRGVPFFAPPVFFSQLSNWFSCLSQGSLFPSPSEGFVPSGFLLSSSPRHSIRTPLNFLDEAWREFSGSSHFFSTPRLFFKFLFFFLLQFIFSASLPLAFPPFFGDPGMKDSGRSFHCV